MASLLVRNLDARTLQQLKKMAKDNGRSLQAEAKTILTEAVPMTPRKAWLMSGEWHKRLAGIKHSDSTLLIREDRDRGH